MHIVLHTVLHTLEDTVGILPFLFLSYLLMEWLEHRAGERTAALLHRSGKIGPLLGGLLGIIPQCGFSASAAGLYAGRVISMGTLLAIFLSTSDEMLPILISHRESVGTILAILGVKALIAVIAGFAVDVICRLLHRADRQEVHIHEHDHDHEHEHGHGHEHEHEHDHDRHHHDHAHSAIHEMCESEGCHCERGIFLSALIHTAKVFAYVLLVTLVFNLILHAVGEDTIGSWLSSVPVLGQLIAGLVGLIPNCASSVVITELYLGGVISLGCMMSGLLVGAGIGIMVLFRTNHRRMKENLLLVAILYAVGVLAGILIDGIGLV